MKKHMPEIEEIIKSKIDMYTKDQDPEILE